MRELCIHVGRAHRWGAAITSQRAQQPIPFREVPDGKLPAKSRPSAASGCARARSG